MMTKEKRDIKRKLNVINYAKKQAITIKPVDITACQEQPFMSG